MPRQSSSRTAWLFILGFALSQGCVAANDQPPQEAENSNSASAISDSPGKVATLPANYSSWTAAEKRAWIWNEGILPSRFSVDHLPPLQDIKILQMIRASMNTKMDHFSDIAPHGWKKSIHRRAIVAQVRYLPEPTSYSGIYQSGALGLVRLSLTYSPEKRGFAPGIALKFFQDGAPSKDASFLNSLDSQGQNYNFFAKPFSNYIPPSSSFGARLVSWIFSRASKPTHLISVQHFADSSDSSPHQLFLRPAPHLTFPESPPRDFRLDFLALRAGQPLLEVFARKNEALDDFKSLTHEKIRNFNESSTKVGTLVLESEFVASEFGDDRLFFRHERP
jgi:hypothetical protein